MEKKNMTISEAAAHLSRNGHQVIGPMGVIMLSHNRLGLKLWAAVDCLCNHHKFRVVHNY